MTAVGQTLNIGRTLWNCRVPMRGGGTLAADVVLPPGADPVPAVVTRTPYMRGRHLRNEGWLRLVGYGYAYVVVDVRGRGDSDGEFAPYVGDPDDGYDVIEWVARQPWCTGRVGMVGGSYDGLTQWWTAKGRPPHLCCIAPQTAGVARSWPPWGTGVPQQYRMWWFHIVTGRTRQHSGAPSWQANYEHLPLRTLHERLGTARKWWPRYVDGTITRFGDDHVLTDDDWSRLELPVLITVGWWDDQEAMTTWQALRRRAPGAAAARLLIGGWDHAGNSRPRPVLGGFDVSASVMDVIGHTERFLARHLKGDAAAAAPPRACRVFRTGRMRWEDLDEWPNPDATPRAWYLASDGDARTLTGAGRLTSSPAGAAGSDGYRYDPAAPAYELSDLGALAWSDPPLDQRYLLRRSDTLVYTGEVLDRAVDVSGRARFEAHVSVDGPDSDICVDLYDAYPDGRFIGLTRPWSSGLLRLSHRAGPAPVPLTPGEIVEVHIELAWLHHTFLPGHRIVVSVTSSAFPINARNLNTGRPWPDAVAGRVARITVHHGTAHPSRLILPVEPA